MMNIVVQDFISSVQGGRAFGKTHPRPPVLGEENEKSSASTRSSGSYRSHISSKSFSSSGKSGSSHRSDTSHKSQSPSGTPRKSNLDKTLTNSLMNRSESITNCDDTNAPLGFEPEGSVDSSPLFTEGSPPAYVKWAESLEHLFADKEGVYLFRHFLTQEHCVETVNFHFACNGIKLYKKPAELDTIANANKSIYRKFIKSETLRLNPNTKRKIAHRLRKDPYDQTIFDEAKEEVEDQIRRDTYPLFLKSDIYLEYIQCGGESPKTSNNSSSSDSCRPPFAMLPTVHEGWELKSNNISIDPKDLSLALTETSLLMTRKTGECSTRPHCERFVPVATNRLPIPCHVSYAPVTAQDSELQSLSSDAQTDDATSHTDSSRDGKEHNQKTLVKKQQKAIQEKALANCNHDLNHHLVPTKSMVPVNYDLARKSPSKFAELLISKLKALRESEEMGEKMVNVLKGVEKETSSSRSLQISKSSASALETAKSSTSTLDKSSTSMRSLSSQSRLFTSTVETDVDMNAESILEEHVSRVWEDGISRVMQQPGIGYDSGEGRFRQPIYPPANSSCLADSSYAKISQHFRRIQEGNSSTDVCSRVKDGSSVGLHNQIQSRSSLGACGSSNSDTRRSINGFQPPAEFQQHVRRDIEQLVHESKLQKSSHSVVQWGGAPHFHSTPKSKAVRPVDSWSDSETWDSRNRMENRSAVEQRHHNATSYVAGGSVTDGQNRSAQHDSYFRSQPNLQDVNRRRTVQFLGSETGSMLPPALPPNQSARNLQSNVSRMELVHCRSSAQHAHPSSSVAMSTSSLDKFQGCNSQTEPNTVDTAPNRLPPVNTGPSPKIATVVGYYFGDEKIPYRTTIPGENITLAQFKRHLSKPGNYRYFFKKMCDEFDSGVVHEEFFHDSDILPLYDGKIWGKVEKKQ